MASAHSGHTKTTTSARDTVKIKQVKKAGMWVRTTVSAGRQTQVWAMSREELSAPDSA